MLSRDQKRQKKLVERRAKAERRNAPVCHQDRQSPLPPDPDAAKAEAGPEGPHGNGHWVPPVTQGPGFTIGYVEEIHGEMGRPVPEFVPTRHELLTLAEHWRSEWLMIELWWLESGSVGSDELRQYEYAFDRMSRATGLIDHVLTAEDRARALEESEEAALPAVERALRLVGRLDHDDLKAVQAEATRRLAGE
jgi:hypothetical protein